MRSDSIHSPTLHDGDERLVDALRGDAEARRRDEQRREDDRRRDEERREDDRRRERRDDHRELVAAVGAAAMASVISISRNIRHRLEI